MTSKFDIGEIVYAKWPGSVLYYKGNIVEYDPIENEYKLQWESDGSSMEIPSNHVHVGYIIPPPILLPLSMF